jgi:hypothetical protein
MEDDGQVVEGSTNGFSGTGLYMPTGEGSKLVAF